MSDFDFDGVIQKRLQGELNTDKAGFGSLNPDKYAELEASKAGKIQALRDNAARLQQRADANKASLVTKWGMDPNSVSGQAVNLLASGYSGASRVAGDLVGFALGDIPAMARSMSLSEDEIAAIGRHKQGAATPEDLALINRQKTPGAHSPLQTFDLATQDRERSANIDAAFDRSDSVHRDNRDALHEQLGDGFQGAWDQTKTGAKALWDGDLLKGGQDLATGLGKLIYNAGEAAVSNPAAASEYIIENLPQLAIGAFGAPGRAALLASNAGYASEQYQKGIAKYQSENNGAYPPEAERQKMAAYAASLALAEQVMDTSLLKGAKGAADAVKETAKTGFLQSIKNIGAVAAKGTAGEALTEGYQTFAEGEASRNPASAQDIYEGAVIGGIAGGGLSGGGRTIGEVLKATPEHAAERAAEAQATQTRNEAQSAAIESGDVTALVDPKSPVYDPVRAVAALYGNSTKPGATEETKQANLEKASQIVADLEKEQAEAQEALDDATPEAQANYRQRLEQAKADGDTAKAELLESMLIEDDPKAQRQRELRLSKLNRRVFEARESLSQFNTGLGTQVSRDMDVDAQVEVLSAPLDTNDTAAVTSRQQEADRLINLSMAIPERLSSSAAKALADNTSNGLTDSQRTYLRSFSDARIAENQLKNMSQVSQEIYTGGNGNVGIAQYRERVATALAANNKAQAQEHLSKLRNFKVDHEAKAAVVAQAWDQGRGTQVGKPAGSPWMVLDRPITRAQLKTIKGLEINTSDLVKDTKTEADAITAALTELEAAFDLKFPTRSTRAPTGESNVSHVPQAHTTRSAKPASKQASKAVGADAAKSTGPVSGPRGTAAALEAAGVVAESSAESTVDSGVYDAVVNAPAAEHSEGETQSKNTKAEADVTTPSSKGVESKQPSGSAEQTPTLTALQEKSAEGTAYNLRNLIADYFTQTASREGDSTQRPLAVVKDFLSQGWDKLSEYLPFDGLIDEQQLVLKFFKTTAADWASDIQANLALRTKEFRFEDLIQFFITEDGSKLDLEENLKTAMAYAAFSWTAENATRSPASTDGEINAILGRDEDHRISIEEEVLRYVGTRQNVVSNALGQRAVQALGLKAVKGAPVDLMPKLESSLGAHIFKMMLDRGLLMRQEVSGEVMAGLTGSEATSKDAVHQFLRLARDGENNLHPLSEEIFQKSMGTSNVLDKLFSVEPGLKEPSLEPVPFNQAKTRNTSQDVPSKLGEIVAQQNAGASFVRGEMYDLVQHLDEDVALAMAGFVESEASTTHKANRPGKQAKNDGLVRELRNIKAFVGGLKDINEQPLYFEHSVWKQQRVGIATNMVNPQSSKIHRHMLYRKSWETEVDTNDSAQMENFQLRVAEGLGVKTDKKGKEAALAEYQKLVASPSLQAAVKVLQKRLAGADLSRSDQETLMQAVKTGGENYHSLSSLMALAQEAMAREAGKDKFSVRLMGEVDGVTNGPMLSHLLMGAAGSTGELFKLLNRGGFFEQGNEHSQYSLWRGALGNFDLYEVTAGHMVKSLQTLMRTGIDTKFMKMSPATVSQVMGTIYGFTGTLADKDGAVQKAGRNIIKTPLTAMVFGSSVPSAVDSMADGFIESIYAAIEDTAQGKARAQSKDQLLENINLLLSQGRGPMVQSGLSIEELMEYEFSKAQIKALKKTFSNTVGAAVAETMTTDFATFIVQRKQFNDAAQTAHALYNAVYTTLREEMVNDLVKSGEIAVNAKTGKPIHDLTQAQENELRKRLAKITPVMHTAFSKESKALRAGLQIAKTTRKLSEKQTFQGNAKFGQPFNDNGAKSTKTRGYEVVEAGPGVAMAPMSVHSTDSYISHMAAALAEVLNVHDAHGTGLASFQKTAQNLNQATWNAMLAYSPAAEMQAALSRTVVGLASMIKEGTLPPTVIPALMSELNTIAVKQEIDPNEVVGLMMVGMKESSFRADDMKLQALAQMQSIDQYALEGGNYEVSDKDRADASALRAELSRDLSEKEKEAIDVIEAALSEKGIETSDKATSSPVELPLEEDHPLTTAPSSPFGALGQSAIASDPELVAFFRENPDAPASEVIKHLYSKLRSSKGRVGTFNLELLRVLGKIVDPDMMFRLVTPDTASDAVLAPPKQPSRAWFVSKGGKSEIYALSPEFINSGLTAETLLHELTHGVLAAIVARELKTESANPKYRSEALELIQELEELREKAKAYAKQNGITGFDAALADLQEFIAWGMTNQGFQRQVISQVSMKSRTGGNELVNGFKLFINKLVGLLFKGSTKSQQEVAENGLTVLISNVSGLLYEADQTGSTPVELNLSQAPDPVGVLNTYSTMDIHDALNAGDVTSEFDTHLRNLLGGIVEKLHGPYGALKSAMQATQALTPLDAWNKAVDTGVAVFASSVQASPLVVSQKEAHAMEQVEATMRAALTSNEVTAKSAHRELRKLYKEASEFLKPTDFAPGVYDYIFNIELDAQGRSDHLARFAAFGLASQEVNRKLQVGTRVLDKEAKKTFAEKLQQVFENILEWFHGTVTKTFGGQRADLKLEALVSQLVDIEAKKRMALVTPARFSPVARIEEGFKDAADYLKAGVVKAANSSFVKNNKNVFVKAAGSVARTVANDQVDAVMAAITDMRNKHVKGKHGVVMGLLNDVKGPGQLINQLSLMSNAQQKERRRLITSTAGFVLKTFNNEGKDLNKQTKDAITQVFLRTGLHTLLGNFNMGEIENLVGNAQARDAAIKTLETQLGAAAATPAVQQHYINKANALAYFKVTGTNRDPVLMMNAHNIARLYGTAYRGRIEPEQANQVEPIIEQLIALYALGYVDAASMTNAKSLLRTEGARTDGGGNGVEFTLKLHKKMEQASKERLFKNQDALVMHGYTPEIYNPNTEVTTATKEAGKELEYRGYTLIGQAELDPADPDRELKYVYVLKDGGLAPYRSGIISFTGKNAKGSKAHSGYMNVNTADGLENAAKHADINSKKPRGLVSGLRPDLSKKKGVHMAPVLNARGEIVNWRYLMQDSTKNMALERDNRFDKVLGMMAGSIYDKETSKEVNVQALEALKETYEAEAATNGPAYLSIGPKSSDPELREIWNMLPDDTKAAVRSIFGRDGLYVRKDVLNPMFGHRKYSLAEAFKKDPELRDHWERLAVYVMENALTVYARTNPGISKEEAEHYAKRAAVAVAQGERIWQELVYEVKDIIVVKSGVVLIGNIWSNISLLAISGIPIKDILKYHLVALRGASAHHADSEKLAELQARIDTGTTGGRDAEIKREIARLQDSLNRNPVKELIDAGLMPTIAEDVVSDDDIYSYKSSLVRKTDSFTGKLNPAIVSAAKNVFMAHDTRVYQGLRRMTQLSDFVARYALYQHLTNRKEDPLSKEDAIFEASDSFVNYDIPMHKGVQYLDDMGVVMFMKYFLRIQRVLFKAFKNNPGRVIGTIALQNFMDLGPIVLDSGWIHKVGNNPLSMGAFQLPGTLDDLATVSAAMAIVK